ncbi:MAG: DEAD/DEAH box helicase [Planctomycetota bacterium]
MIDQLQSDPGFMGQVARWVTVPEEPARYADCPAGVDDGLRAALAGRGVKGLYTHQAEAASHALAGRNVCVVTPTASGKTLCYNLPVIQALREDNERRALYLFPTKALSQDQVHELTGLCDSTGDGFKTYTYDGDTPPQARQTLRKGGHIVVTNPYMLHQGILPNHPRWTQLFQNLKYVVIDELHTYRGVFGSHVANVIRRLKRVCRHYGSEPQFICTSATIGNPKELAERLVEAPFELVDESGAPRGAKHFVLYNPPIVHPTMGIRRAAVEEVRRVLERVLPFEVQAIVFGRSRNQVEVLTKYGKDAARKVGLDPDRVCGYRGGYLAKLRRRVEQGLRSGEVRAVVSTNALELGVDIGALDVALLTGYPGSIASFFQQVGRAGRRGRSSLAIMVARSSPMDQFLLQHPDYLFEQPKENTVIDPDNLLIKVNHVKCSAFEIPFAGDEAFADTPVPAGREDPALPEVAEQPGAPRVNETREILDYLSQDAGILHRAGERYYWMAEAYPAQGVSLTTTDIDNFIVYDTETRKIMAEVDRPSAMTEIYEGAIYGWQGEQYIIELLDYENRRAYARKVNCDYYTDSEVDRKLRPLESNREQPFPAYTARLIECEVTTKATIYKKIKFYTRENVGAGEIHLPEEVMDTTACTLTIDREVAAELGLLGPNAAALLGLRNLFKNVLPLFVRCDGRDVGVWSAVRDPSWNDLPTLSIFDRMPSGTGLAERTFACHQEVLETMRSVIRGCTCERGCPGCVGVADEIGARGRAAAAKLLDRMLDGTPPPSQPPLAG